MKLYLVLDDAYVNGSCAGIFSTRQLAQEYIDRNREDADDKYTIELWRLDHGVGETRNS